MTAAPAVEVAIKRPVLVLSVGHSLLPFAFRLQREGHEVQVACVHCSPRYQRAWAGKFTSFLPPSKSGVDAAVAEKVVSAAREAGAWVLTNSLKWTEALQGAGLEGVFGQPQRDELPPPIQAGAWFNGQEFSGAHLLVWDLGVWPGGLGPLRPAGVTLVRAPRLQALLEPLRDSLRESGYKGLVSVALSVEDGKLTVREPTLGWHPLHAHAFVSELESLGAVLEGEAPKFPKRFVCCVPVSVPPWPTPSAQELVEQPIDGLVREQLGQVFFHDMRIVDGKPTVAGLDGLVCVARGTADHFDLARAKALQLAGAIRLREKQWRPDFGGAVSTVMAALEQLGMGL